MTMLELRMLEIYSIGTLLEYRNNMTHSLQNRRNARMDHNYSLKKYNNSWLKLPVFKYFEKEYRVSEL